MIEFVGIRAKTWTYLMEDGSEHKEGKGTKRCVIKRELMVKNYKVCFFDDKTILKSQKDLKVIIKMKIRSH